MGREEDKGFIKKRDDHNNAKKTKGELIKHDYGRLVTLVSRHHYTKIFSKETSFLK